MYSDTQLGAAHLVAAALGRALGIRVVISNVPTACTDGNTIYLPPLPVTVSSQLIAMLWGFIHHEAGHCRHSDFGVLQDLAAEHDALLLQLARVFEDIRMERAHIALYPGAHRVLCELVEVLVEIGFFKRPDPDSPPAALAVGLILKSLRSTLLGQTALSEQAQLHRELVEQALGRGSVTRLLALSQTVCDARSSEDAINLAYRVREFLEEEQKKAEQPPPPSPQSPKDSQDGAPGGTPQTSDANGSDDAESSGQGADANDTDDAQSPAQDADPSDEAGPAGDADGPKSSPPADDPEQSDSSQPPASSSNPASDPTDDPDASSNPRPDGSSSDGSSSAADPSGRPHPPCRLGLERSLRVGRLRVPPVRALWHRPLRGNSGSRRSPRRTDQREVDQVDGSERMVLPGTLPMGSAQRDAEAIHSALQVSAKLSIQLKRQLESERRMPSIPKSSGRRVSRRHLHRVAFKDYRVFERRVVQTAVNTSVVCLLDCSGSMGWDGGTRIVRRSRSPVKPCSRP
jgi:cobaltochelatase CobT